MEKLKDIFSVSFKQKNHSLYLSINIKGRTTKISLSSVYPPFHDLADFLHNTLNDKDANLEIDQEGSYAYLIAKKLKENKISLIIKNKTLLVKSGKYKNFFAQLTCNKSEFAEEVIKELIIFIKKEYNEAKWFCSGYDNEKMPYDKIFRLMAKLNIYDNYLKPDMISPTTDNINKLIALTGKRGERVNLGYYSKEIGRLSEIFREYNLLTNSTKYKNELKKSIDYYKKELREIFLPPRNRNEIFVKYQRPHYIKEIKPRLKILQQEALRLRLKK